jgi:hypothetical protein
MPWNEVSVMDQRREFVRLALQEGPTGGSCVDGSISARMLATSGLRGGRPAIGNWPIIRVDRT